MYFKIIEFFFFYHIVVGSLRAENILETVRIVFFYGDRYEDQRPIPLSDSSSITSQPEFNTNKKTLLYIFGYIENMNAESLKTIVAAYQKRNEHNILVFDYTKVAARNYIFQTFPDIIQLSGLLANEIINIFANGLNTETFHIVAHSLGAQLASMTARNIKLKSNYKIKRISALDPAFPLFYPGLIASHLNKYDAEFVDVIHTDAFLYGAPISTGTADFWPNGGRTLQPGCPKRNYQFLSANDLCSHWRSWKFWAESVTSPETFKARKCSSWKKFSDGLCKYNEVVTMGHDCPTNIKGDYYLQTNDQLPFARGVAVYVPRYKSF